MKKLLYFITCITLFSCSKDPNTPSGTNASGSIQYKINGNLVVMDNVDLLTGQYVIFSKYLLPTFYVLGAQKGANNRMSAIIVTDSLKTINYHYDSLSSYLSFIIDYNGQASALLFKNDYFDVNITSYQNARISGTFTAKYTPYSTTGFGQYGSTLITEGKLNNVQVVY